MLVITHLDGQQDSEPFQSFADELVTVARDVDTSFTDGREQPNPQLLFELEGLKVGHDVLGCVGLVVLVDVVPDPGVGIPGQIPGTMVWLMDFVPLAR